MKLNNFENQLIEHKILKICRHREISVVLRIPKPYHDSEQFHCRLCEAIKFEKTNLLIEDLVVLSNRFSIIDESRLILSKKHVAKLGNHHLDYLLEYSRKNPNILLLSNSYKARSIKHHNHWELINRDFMNTYTSMHRFLLERLQPRVLDVRDNLVIFEGGVYRISTLLHRLCTWKKFGAKDSLGLISTCDVNKFTYINSQILEDGSFS